MPWSNQDNREEKQCWRIPHYPTLRLNIKLQYSRQSSWPKNRHIDQQTRIIRPTQICPTDDITNRYFFSQLKETSF